MSKDATLDEFVGEKNKGSVGQEEDTEELEQEQFGPFTLSTPGEWTAKRLGDIKRLITRGKQPTYDDEGVPVINQECIYWDGWYFENLRYLDSKVAEEWKDKYFPQVGDVILNSTGQGTLGRAQVYPDNERRAIDSHVTLLRTNDELNPYFHRYFLESYLGQALLYSMCVNGSTGQIELSKTRLDLLPTPLPPLSEQRKIATVLYTIDQAIEKTEEIIEQTNRVRRGFIRERVVAANSDGKRKEGIVGTRRVSIPDHWSTVRLGDVAEIVSGKSFPREYQEGHAGPRAVIKVEDMNLPGNDKYIEDVTNRVTDEVLDKLNKNVFPADTVIHPRVGEALLLNKTRMTTEEAAFDDNIMGWVPNGINSEYLYYASTLVDFNAVAQTGTVPSINKEMAANFRFPLPPEDEQEEIAEDLSRIDGQVSVYEEEKAQLQRLKRGLIQDLLSGIVRTADTNIEVPNEIIQYG